MRDIMRIKSMFFSLTALIALGAAGCGPAPVETGTLSGKVTFDDKPVTSGKVQVQNESGTAFAAKTDGEGKYTVAEPVPVGKYKVIVLPNDEAPPAGSVPPPPKPKDTKDIPEKYRQVLTSGLETTVNKGPNTYDVKMTSK